MLSKGTSSWQFMQFMLRIICSSVGKTSFFGSRIDLRVSPEYSWKSLLTVIGPFCSSEVLTGDFEGNLCLFGLVNIGLLGLNGFSLYLRSGKGLLICFR